MSDRVLGVRLGGSRSEERRGVRGCRCSCEQSESVCVRRNGEGGEMQRTRLRPCPRRAWTCSAARAPASRLAVIPRSSLPSPGSHQCRATPNASRGARLTGEPDPLLISSRSTRNETPTFLQRSLGVLLTKSDVGSLIAHRAARTERRRARSGTSSTGGCDTATLSLLSRASWSPRLASPSRRRSRDW